MQINTKTVQGRRPLQFCSMDDLVADAQMLAAAAEVKMLGNWPLDRLFAHLATAMNSSIDGIDIKAPWFVRYIVARLLKMRVLERRLDPGFSLPKDRVADAFPDAGPKQNAFDELRAAAARVQTEPMTAKHPVFGRLTNDEWYQLHLRHAEMHLSFAVPK